MTTDTAPPAPPERSTAATATAAATGRRRLPPSTAAMGFVLVVLLVVWAAVVLMLLDKRAATLAAEVRQNTNLARVLNEQALRVIAAADQATLRVRDDIASGRTPLPDLARYANETGLAPAILVQLALVDAEGRLVGSNLDPDGRKTGQVDLSDREHIRVHLNPALAAQASSLPANGLFISKPVLGKVSRRWTIQLSRRISAADGRPLGVVVASLDPGHFEQVFSQVALGQQGGVTLAGTDLTIRARVIGGRAVDMGGQVGPGSPLARGALQTEGHYTATSAIDGVERVIAYHKVADYPIYIFVVSSTSEALAGWRSYRNLVLGLSLLLSLAVAAGTVILLGSLRRLERSHEALAQSEAQAQSASRAKSEFLAAVSHELRTPLTSIRGFAELMEHRLPQPGQREQAGLIRKAAEHLNALLTEILDMAKVEAGEMSLNAEPQNLRELVAQTVGLFQVSAAEKGLTLAAEVADDVPATWLCDGLRLKQVLHNLLSNAVKFTASGGIRLTVALAGDGLVLQVIDTGPGIAPELRETVFERFRQGHARVSYQHGGTGLGLALARALAERMGGTLTLASELGRGSRFMLQLPALPPA